MAAANSSRSQEIQIENCHWGRWSRGTRGDLIQHGITQDGPFPGDPGVRKTVCKAVDPLGREITIRRRSKTTFDVFRDWTEEEVALRDARLAREGMIERAWDKVNSWPKSTDAFRESALYLADIGLAALKVKLIDGCEGGYRLSDEAAGRFAQLADEMMGLIKTGSIVLDQRLRDGYIPSCILKDVKAAEESAPVQYVGNVLPFRPRHH